jgi:hypothetical protein
MVICIQVNMEETIEFKKNKDRYDVRVGSKNKNSTTYFNILNRDPSQFAQVLIDLELIAGMPVEKAIKIYLSRKKKGDWLGI